MEMMENQETMETMESKSYSIRPFCSRDVFAACKILSKIGISEFRKCFESDEVKAAIAKGDVRTLDWSALGVSIAFDAADILLANITKCESDIYSFLASLTGLKESEISELAPGDFVQLIFDVAKNDGFKDFIKVVSKLRG